MLGVAVDQVRQGPFRRFRAEQVTSGLDSGFVLLGPSDGICLPVEGLGLPGVPLQAYISCVADFAVFDEAALVVVAREPFRVKPLNRTEHQFLEIATPSAASA